MSNTPVATPVETHWEEWLWQRCLAPKTSLVLFVLIILGLLVGQFVPQLHGDARRDPAAYERWLQTIPELFRRVEAALNRVGLFDIRHGWLFQALLVVAAVVSIVALGGRLDAMLRPRRVLLHHLSSKQERTGVALPETLVDVVIRAVGAPGGAPGGVLYQATAGNRTVAYGWRPRWVQPLATLVSLGLLLTVLGIVLDLRWGWDVSAVALSPQTVVRMTPNRMLSLVSFDRAQAVLDVGRGVRHVQVVVGENSVASSGGLRCRVVGTGGLYVQVRAVDQNGVPLNLYPYVARPEPVQTLTKVFSADATQDSLVFFIPSQNIVAQLSQIDRTALRLGLSNGAGQELSVQTLPVSETDSGGTIEVDGTSLHIEATYFPMLALSYRPGDWLLWVGVLLVVIGGVFDAIPVQTLWVEMAGEADRIVIQVRQTPPAEQVAQQIEAALQTSGMSFERRWTEDQ